MPPVLKLSKEKTKHIVQTLLLGRELGVDGCRWKGYSGSEENYLVSKHEKLSKLDIMRNQITFWKEPSIGPITLIAPALNLRTSSFLGSCLAKGTPV